VSWLAGIATTLLLVITREPIQKPVADGPVGD
jgi:hypothetical protein